MVSFETWSQEIPDYRGEMVSFETWSQEIPDYRGEMVSFEACSQEMPDYRAGMVSFEAWSQEIPDYGGEMMRFGDVKKGGQAALDTHMAKSEETQPNRFTSALGGIGSYQRDPNPRRISHGSCTGLEGKRRALICEGHPALRR